jgi:uncharacterized protein (TIGR02300 family)
MAIGSPDREPERRDHVTKPEWGTKRVCGSCGAHFYDMRKATIVCPKCKTVYDPDAVMKSRRRVAEKMTPVKSAVEPGVDDVVVDVDTDVEDEELGDEEDVVLEDASELGEDDEDISEAIEKGDEEV